MSINSQPLLVYIEQPIVNQQVDLLNDGRLESLVEEYSKTEETAGNAGANIYGVLRAFVERTTGETETNKEKIRQSDIGRFAVYHAEVEDSENLRYINSVDEDVRDTIDNSDIFVSIAGNIRRTPLNLFDHYGDKYQLYDSNDIAGDNVTMEQLSGAAQYFEISMEGMDGAFRFKLYDDRFTGIERDFPDNRHKYTVLATVRHVYRGSDEDHHLDVITDVNLKDRRKRIELRRSLMSGVDKLEQLVERSVSVDELKNSPPDVELEPIAVYRS